MTFKEELISKIANEQLSFRTYDRTCIDPLPYIAENYTEDDCEKILSDINTLGFSDRFPASVNLHGGE